MMTMIPRKSVHFTLKESFDQISPPRKRGALPLKVMDTKKIKYQWAIAGTYSGKGYGWSKSPEAAKKSAEARLKKIKKGNPNNGTSYSIRICKAIHRITHRTDYYEIDSCIL